MARVTNDDIIKYKNEEIERLEKENKKLKERIKELEQCNINLQERLDNKEKLNEEYRKQIDKYKSDLGEAECSFGFEADECGYRKREYKRLKQRIKEHCKGYGNLFPEDEMKRQWKKADKKRKKEEIRVSRDEHSYDEIFGDDELIYEEGLYD